jgi:hypothetical protein
MTPQPPRSEGQSHIPDIDIDSLIAALTPTELFPRIADEVERAATDLDAKTLNSGPLPLDARGILNDVGRLLRHGGKVAEGPDAGVLTAEDLPILCQVPGLDLQAATTTAKLVDSAPGATQPSTSGAAPSQAVMGIYLSWRDLNASLWPSSLEAIPIVLRTALMLLFQQIEQHSRGVIRARVFDTIQEAINDGSTLVLHIDLVLPSFIVELFGEDPEYPEMVDVRGRAIMLGLPVAGRPIIKPPIGRPIGAPPGSPLVPLGRPLTAQSLLTGDGWKKFVDELETTFENLGVNLAQTVITQIALALVEHVISAAADFATSEGLDNNLEKLGETLQEAVDATPIGDLIDGIGSSAFGQALKTIGETAVDVLDEIVDFLEQMIVWAQNAGAALATGALGAAGSPLGLLVEIGGQLVDEIFTEIKEEAFGELVWRPVYELLFGEARESVSGSIAKGLFKELEGVRRLGYITQIERPDTPEQDLPAGCRITSTGYSSSTIFKIKKLGKGQDYNVGTHTLDEGVVLDFKTLSGQVFREVGRVITDHHYWEDDDENPVPAGHPDAKKQKQEILVEVKASSQLNGIDGGPLTIPFRSMVLVATDFQEGMDPDYLNLAMVYHAALERLQDYLEDEISDAINDLFQGIRDGLAEDQPQQFSAQVENKVQTVIDDTLARLVGANDFAELDSGRRRELIRAIPVGALGGGQIDVDAQRGEWLLLGGQFSAEDAGTVSIEVSSAAQPSNNGEFPITAVVAPNRVETAPGLLVTGPLGPDTLVKVVRYNDLDSEELLFWTLDELRLKVVEGINKVVSKQLEKLLEKGLDKLTEKVTDKITGTEWDVDDLNAYFIQQTTLYGGWTGRTLKNTITFHVNRLTSALVNELKIADFLDFGTAIKNFVNLTEKDTIEVNGQQQPNPAQFDLAAVVSDVVTAAIMEIIARAFIVQVVVGFELTGGREEEGGGVLSDWAAGLFLFNKITGNTAEGSGDGGGVFVRGYLPNVFIFNEIEDNVARDIGGGVYLDKSLTSWVLNTITDNEATLGGGVYLDKRALTLWVLNEIEDNHAENGGGLASDCRLNIWLANDIRNNKADVLGGGALLRDEGLFVYNKFSGNEAVRGAGVAYTGQCRVETKGNEIKRNIASDAGGGFAVLGIMARPDIGSDRVHRNEAIYGGGGFVGDDGRAEISGTRFANNFATETGGGLHVESSTIRATKIIGASFYGNEAQRGGGIWTARSGGVFACYLSANSGFQNGGGIYVEDTEVFHVQGCMLAGNWASDTGGGMAAYRLDNVWVHASRWLDNRVFQRHGAGLYAEEVQQLVVESSAVERNFVDIGGNGGGVGAFKCPAVRLTRTDFLKNGTEHYRGNTVGMTGVDVCAGGGAWIRECPEVTVIRTQWISNGAERGGGLALIECAQVSVTRSKFRSNCADLNHDGFGLGGAIFATGDPSEIRIGGLIGEANSFSRNTAGTPPAVRNGSLSDPEGSGGAIAIDDGPRVIIEGNHFQSNAAWDLGGGILLRDTAANSRIGGENNQSPPSDPDAAGRQYGNLCEESCAVEIETYWPWEAGPPQATETVLTEGPVAAIGVRRLMFGLPDQGKINEAIDEANDEGGLLAFFLVRRIEKLKTPIWAPWPAERDTSSDWNTPVSGHGIIPPWPPTAAWTPSHPVRLHQWGYTDSQPIISDGLNTDPPREIVTRRGGLFAIVRGGGTAVVGNWVRRNYAIQMGGGGYVAESDDRTVIGIAPSAPESHANLFTMNVSSLGGGLALERTSCYVMENTFGGDSAEAHPGNLASGGGAILAHRSACIVQSNIVVGNLAGHTISEADADRFPGELIDWISRGLLAFGGGIAVTGDSGALGTPKLTSNDIRRNAILEIPDYESFQAAVSAPPTGPTDAEVAAAAAGTAASPSGSASGGPVRISPIPISGAFSRFFTLRTRLSLLLPGAAEPSSTPKQLQLLPGDYLFGAGVALLETGAVGLFENRIMDNRITATETMLEQPLNLVGGGLAGILVDAPSGKAVEINGFIERNRIELPHEGIDPAMTIVGIGGGIGWIASRGLNAEGVQILRNLVFRDLPQEGKRTPILIGRFFGGGVGSVSAERIHMVACRIERNALFGLDSDLAAAGGGVSFEDARELELEGLEIVRNWSHRDGGGLSTGGDITGKIDHCTIADNFCPSRGDAWYVNGDAYRLEADGNLLRAHPGHNGAALFVADGSRSPSLHDNAIDAVTGPEILGPGASGGGFTALRAGFADADGGDYRLAGSSPAVSSPGGGPYGSQPVNGGVTLSHQILKVPANHPTIEDALGVAARGDVVVVSPGTYEEYGLVVPDGVVLISESGPAETRIEVPANAPDDVIVLQVAGERKSTTIAGFSIKGQQKGLAVSLPGQFRGHLSDLVIKEFSTGVAFEPLTVPADLLDRSVLANLTLRKCEVGIKFSALRQTWKRPGLETPCRAPVPPHSDERIHDAADAVLHHNIAEECPIGFLVERPSGSTQEPVASRFVARNDVFAGSVSGFIPDLLELNENQVDDPYFLSPPPPEDDHPTENTGSMVLDSEWPDDHRTFGSLEPMPPRPPTTGGTP